MFKWCMKFHSGRSAGEQDMKHIAINNKVMGWDSSGSKSCQGAKEGYIAGRRCFPRLRDSPLGATISHAT